MAVRIPSLGGLLPLLTPKSSSQLYFPSSPCFGVGLIPKMQRNSINFISTINMSSVAHLQGHFVELQCVELCFEPPPNNKQHRWASPGATEHVQGLHQHFIISVPRWVTGTSSGAMLSTAASWNRVFLLWIDIPSTCSLCKFGSAATKRTLNAAHFPATQPLCLHRLFCVRIAHVHDQKHCCQMNLKDNLHIFVPHVVVVLKDRWDALFIFR